MQSNIRCGPLFAALAMSLMVVGTVNAQQPQIQQRQVQPAQPGQPLPGQPAQPGQPRVIQQRPVQGQPQAGHGTHVMAHWLLVDNQGEIELAKFAQEKAQNEEVKEFAKMMIQDHSDFLQSLQEVAGGLGGQGQPGQPGQPPQPRQFEQRQQGEAQAQPQRDQDRLQDNQGQAQNQPDRRADQEQAQNQQDRQQAGQDQAQPNRAQPGQFSQPAQPGRPGQPGQPGQIPPRTAQPGAPGQAGGMEFDIVRIKHELGQQCLASTKKMLGEKEGAEFDTCYMDHQLVMHMQMLDTLKVFKRHAQGEFAELLENGISTTEDHLMHAEKLVKQLHGGAAASTARRPGAQRD